MKEKNEENLEQKCIFGNIQPPQCGCIQRGVLGGYVLATLYFGYQMFSNCAGDLHDANTMETILNYAGIVGGSLLLGTSGAIGGGILGYTIGHIKKKRKEKDKKDFFKNII